MGRSAVSRWAVQALNWATRKYFGSPRRPSAGKKYSLWLAGFGQLPGHFVQKTGWQAVQGVTTGQAGFWNACVAPQYVTLRCNTLHYDTIRCTTIQYVALGYNMLQHDTIHCNTIMQQTALQLDCTLRPQFFTFNPPSPHLPPHLRVSDTYKKHSCWAKWILDLRFKGGNNSVMVADKKISRKKFA